MRTLRAIVPRTNFEIVRATSRIYRGRRTVTSFGALTSTQEPAVSRTVVRRKTLAANVLFPVGIVLWIIGVLQVDASHLGPYGLPAVLPVIYYAGIALVVSSAAINLARDDISPWKMSLHAVALVLMLYGTAPLVYPEGRYSWLYKTIGVVQYVNAHGALNSHIDIYQNWPGFFALAAWFDKAAGVATPLVYAKWAQPAFELLALPLLYLIYQALSLTARQVWVAILLFVGANWIGQDYFSPQALGVLLSLGVIDPAQRARRSAAPPGPRQDGAAELPVVSTWLLYLVIVVVFCVLTFTHQLSPYMLIVQLAALAVTRRLRPRWLPAVLAAIALGYFVPRFGFVNQHFGVLSSIGQFFTNLTPPSLTLTNATFSQLVIQRSALLLSVGIWLTALAGCWRRWRSGQPVLHLALLAFSPVILLAVQDYGHEGVLRFYLFSLPWSAALAAFALAPAPASVAVAEVEWPARLAGLRALLAGLRARLAGLRALLAKARVRLSGLLARLPGENPALALRMTLALSVALTLFYPAFYGDDAMNVMSRSEVTTLNAFLRTAKPGPIYCAIKRAPLVDTARYDLFPVGQIFGATGLLGTIGTGPLPAHPARTLRLASRLANDMLARVGSNQQAYVVISPSMLAYNAAYRIVNPEMFTILERSLRRSIYWQQVVSRSGTVIFELRPTVPTNPTSLGGH
jgi:hypothetical protein